MSHNNNSMLDIYQINYSSTFEENLLGQAISQRSKDGSWWEILWTDSTLLGQINLKSNKHTIVHEIGNCLGLNHPFNDAYNILWDSEVTIMSYNRGPNGWNDWFSSHDLNALISIWERENDLGLIKF